MTWEASAAPDVPAGASVLHRLHARLGRFAIGAKLQLQRPVSLGVRALVINAEDEILLVRHSYLPGLSLPGGGVDPGETCHEAIVREVEEETGVALSGSPALFHIYLNPALGNRDHVVLFTAKTAQKSARAPRSLEIVSAGFYLPASLPEDLTTATRARIDEVRCGASLRDHW